MQPPGGDKLISIRTEEVDEATGLLAIVNNVSFVMHTNRVQLSVTKAADITTKLGQISTVGEVLNVLAKVKSLTADSKDHLEAAAKILDTLNRGLRMRSSWWPLLQHSNCA